MARTHNLGFPRIGAQRELKFALEKHWRGASTHVELADLGRELCRQNWQRQSSLDLCPVGDFSFYDHVLDTSFLLGNVPVRALSTAGRPLDAYFRLARGRASGETGAGIAAGEMTKWFDTNYHYIVPELARDSDFTLDPASLLAQLAEAREAGVRAKPVLIGPVTYLWLAKARDGSDRLSLLPKLLPVYRELLLQLSRQGVEWVQIDEPALVTELGSDWQQAYRTAYEALQGARPQLLLTTYFGRLGENLKLAAGLPVEGVHLDALSARAEVETLLNALPPGRVLSLGVLSGRNIWRADLQALLDELEPLHQQLGERLWLAPSCSLLHVPVDLESENNLDPELRSWLAFAQQKLDELEILGRALSAGRGSVRAQLDAAEHAVSSRRHSPRVHDASVQARLKALDPSLGQRKSPYRVRSALQARAFRLPRFPTTTIGSFPQTAEIRKSRSEFRAGKLEESRYRAQMRAEIERVVKEQEKLGLDVLVHGEAERNDMVEYFGEQLHGYAFSEFGWVQSYGSRCVKPPILFGDVSRPRPMTVDWTAYAQGLTARPMKGMLTGPITLLQWSFVRDDQPRADTALQIALAIRDEVQDLEAAGIGIIQIDEPAIREGLPLRRAQWSGYLHWAARAFRISAGGVAPHTQIHTHMCYSEFNDILPEIAAMDADVITIETSRSDMELLRGFGDFRYPNEIGPGVYDIHSPRVPPAGEMLRLLQKAAAVIPPANLWVNPDCGLKTRRWPETEAALQHMVEAARQLREQARA